MVMKVEITLPGNGRDSNMGDCGAKSVIETFTLPSGKIVVKLGGILRIYFKGRNFRGH